MGIATLGRLGQLVDDMLRRRLVRVAHAKIDNILTTRPCRGLQLIDNVENIRRQAFNAGKFFYHTDNRVFR